MQDWKVHGYERSCNEFDLTKAQANDSARVRSERELERYLFCFQRFQNHHQGQDFCQQQLDNFRIKQQEREEMDISFDWNALQQALRQLVECRRVLKYTYVVTYSLADEPLQRQLFENHQGLLERFTEQLSEITEKGYKQIDHWTLVNLTKTVEKYTVGVMECLDAQQQEDENDEV
jgi:ariadne-1